MATPPFSAQHRNRQSVPIQGAPKHVKQVSGANAAQSVVIAGDPEARVSLRKIMVFASAAASVTVTLSDGTMVLDLGTVALTTEAKVFDLSPLTSALGASWTVSVGAGGVGVTTTLSVIADLL